MFLICKLTFTYQMGNCCSLNVRWTKGNEDFEDAFSVREKVFIIEQNVDEEDELDTFDDLAWHIVLYDDRIPIATGRVFKKRDSCVIGRVCVLKEYRGRSIGKQLISHLLEKADQMGLDRLELESQMYAVDFYRRVGFQEYGEIFLDAGIEHIKMIKWIN